MKKVRYLAGAAGLLPATAFIAPAAAHAATTPQPAHPHARTKAPSLRGIHMGTLHRVPIGAAPQEPGGCGSVGTGWINHNHMSIRFWYNFKGCIGTVQLKIYPENINSCAFPDFHIYPHDAGTYTWSAHHSYCSEQEFSVQVQKSFPTPVGVWGQGWSYVAQQNLILGAVGKNVDPPFAPEHDLAQRNHTQPGRVTAS